MNYNVQSDYKLVDKRKWDSFVINHPQGTTFQMFEMVQLYEQTKRYIPIVSIVEDENLDVVGVLVAFIQKEFSGIIGFMTSRSIIIGGPLVKGNSVEIINLLMNCYLLQIKKKVIYSQFRNLYDMQFMHHIFIKNGFVYEDHLDIIHDLTIGEQQILAKINKNKRANVTKSLHKGVCFEEIQDVSSFECCINQIFDTYNRVGLPNPSRDFFINAFNLLYPNGLLKIFVAIYNQKIIGTRLELLCGKKKIYDWYAGSDNQEKNKYPNDFLPLHILLWGASHGYQFFDFGGAGKPNVYYGVREHKVKFGGKLVNYGRYTYIHNHFFMKVGEKLFAIYKIIKKQKSKR